MASTSTSRKGAAPGFASPPFHARRLNAQIDVLLRSLHKVSQIKHMFSEVELERCVAIISEKLRGNRRDAERSIMTHLLKILSYEQASKEHGYYLSVTRLKSIGKLELPYHMRSQSSKWSIFSVSFNCKTFLPRMGETLYGVVRGVCSLGVLLRCGPVKNAFLSGRTMPGYRFVREEEPFFLGRDLTRIEVGAVVRFVVLGVRWKEAIRMGVRRRDFWMLASIDGDSLGPVSMPGLDELEL